MLHAKVRLWLIHSLTHQVSESINSSPQANELMLVLDTSLSHDYDIKYTCYSINCLLLKYFGEPSLCENTHGNIYMYYAQYIMRCRVVCLKII